MKKVALYIGWDKFRFAFLFFLVGEFFREARRSTALTMVQAREGQKVDEILKYKMMKGTIYPCYIR